jgi:hypothetical protein
VPSIKLLKENKRIFLSFLPLKWVLKCISVSICTAPYKLCHTEEVLGKKRTIRDGKHGLMFVLEDWVLISFAQKCVLSCHCLSKKIVKTGTTFKTGSGKKGGLMENWYIGLDFTENKYWLPL